MAKTTVSRKNMSRPAPKWFRKGARIFKNLENAAVLLLLGAGYAAESFLILCIKIGTDVIITNMEILLANGEEYAPVKKVEAPIETGA